MSRSVSEQCAPQRLTFFMNNQFNMLFLNRSSRGASRPILESPRGASRPILGALWVVARRLATDFRGPLGRRVARLATQPWRWDPDDFRYFSDFRGLPIGKFPEKSRNRPDPNSTPHFGRISMKSMSEGWIRTIYRFLGIFEGSPSANFRKNPGNRPDTTSSPHVENTLKRVANTLKTMLKTC